MTRIAVLVALGLLLVGSSYAMQDDPRFTGKSVFYNNVELRIKLFDFTSFITPGSFGLIGFNDIGRVWIPNEKSTTWHSGSGGGIYIIPADLIVVQGLVGFSDEGVYPYFSIGFRF